MNYGMYRHYKGTVARVIGIAKHTETQEEFVIYEHIDKETGENTLWARPKAMFLELVTVNGREVPRFQFLDKKSS